MTARQRPGFRRGWRRAALTAACAALVVSIHSPAPSGSEEPALPPLEHFLPATERWPAPALSDDGRYIAYKGATAKGAVLVLAAAADPEESVRTLSDPGDCIVGLRWAGDGDWLVLQTRPDCSFTGPPRPGFTVFAISRREGQRRPVAGPAPFRYQLVTSPERPDEVAVLRDKRDQNATTVEIVDLAEGTRRATTVPAGTTGIYLDQHLRARLISQRSKNGGFLLKARQASDQWREVGRYGNAERDGFRVLGFSADGRNAVLIDTLEQDKAAVMRLELASGERELLFSHPRWQVTDAVLDAARSQTLAVQLHGHRRRWDSIAPKLSGAFERLASLGDVDVSILDTSADGRIWLVAVESDRAPRRFGLLDVAGGDFTYLPYGAGDPYGAGESETLPGFAKTPVELTANDGVLLTGYLTLPAAAHGGQAVPMVQRVHGGPVLRHSWAFDPTTQWLASRGYAVLEINFRGSGGFGPSWQRQGYGQWGRRMQQDLEDAARWAVERGIAQPGRIAIMGHSYGGYAALMGLARFPQRYACGVALSAPTDLSQFLETLRRFRTLARTESQRAFVASQIARYETELGQPENDLDTVSPLALVESIESPLLLFHGQADRGVPPRQAEAFFDRLAVLDRSAALIRFSGEGHRILDRDNRLVMMSLTEDFLASCLGGVRKEGPRYLPTPEQASIAATGPFIEHFGLPVPLNAPRKPAEK